MASSLGLAVAEAALAAAAGSVVRADRARRRALGHALVVEAAAGLRCGEQREIAAVEGALHLHRALRYEPALGNGLEAVHVGLDRLAEDQIDCARDDRIERQPG